VIGAGRALRYAVRATDVALEHLPRRYSHSGGAFRFILVRIRLFARRRRDHSPKLLRRSVVEKSPQRRGRFPKAFSLSGLANNRKCVRRGDFLIAHRNVRNNAIDPDRFQS
jgi:hypothetical protein